MHHPTHARQDGLVLFHAVLLVLVLFGLTAALVFVNTAESRAVQESTARRQAFFMAEAGLEAAKWELTDSQDPDGDGVGNRTFTAGGRTYQVVATDLGGGTYRLDSTGAAGSTTITLQSIVAATSATTFFPFAAISMLGSFDDSKTHIRKHMDLIIDGGNSPAILTSQKSLYNQLNTEFEAAIAEGLVLEANITGTIEGEGLPFAYQPDYPTNLQDLEGIYQALVDTTASLLPQTTDLVMVDDDGTTNTTGVRWVDSLTLGDEQRLSGSGTLIVSNQLNISRLGSLNWDGNVIVISHDDSIQADLTVRGTMNVTGNVVVLGESLVGQGADGSRVASSSLNVLGGGSATVNGSVFVGSSYGTDKDTESTVWVQENGSLTVNGIVSNFGRMVKTQVDNGGDFTLNGMLQTSSPYDPYGDVNNLKLMMQLSGNINIHKDDAHIATGAEALNQLGTDFDIENQMVQVVMGGVVETVSWKPIHE